MMLLMLISAIVILLIVAGISLLSPDVARTISLWMIKRKEGAVYEARRVFINSNAYLWHIRIVGVIAIMMVALIVIALVNPGSRG